MIIFYYTIATLFCIGFMWGMRVDADRSGWLFRAVIGGLIFVFIPVTLPVSLYFNVKKADKCQKQS